MNQAIDGHLYDQLMSMRIVTDKKQDIHISYENYEESDYNLG